MMSQAANLLYLLQQWASGQYLGHQKVQPQLQCSKQAPADLWNALECCLYVTSDNVTQLVHKRL